MVVVVLLVVVAPAGFRFRHIHLRLSFRLGHHPWGALRRITLMIPAPFPTLQRDLDSLLLLALVALAVLALVVVPPAFFDPLQPLLQMPTTTTLVGVVVRIPRWNLPSHRT